MTENIHQEARRAFNDCKYNVIKKREDTIPYLSGTLNKRTRMYKEAKRIREDAQIDYELGVINKDQYEIEIKAVNLFEKALANYKLY